MTDIRPGAESFCTTCNGKIRYTGKYWEHIGATPRHPAVPLKIGHVPRHPWQTFADPDFVAYARVRKELLDKAAEGAADTLDAILRATDTEALAGSDQFASMWAEGVKEILRGKKI